MQHIQYRKASAGAEVESEGGGAWLGNEVVDGFGVGLRFEVVELCFRRCDHGETCCA